MILVQASNIHTGGGAVLLNEVLKSLDSLGQPCTVFVDTRFKHPLFNNIVLRKVQPSLVGRLMAEWQIFRQGSQQSSTILCFGNLPPLFPVKGKAVLFFQNVILLDKYSSFLFSWKVSLKHKIERFWLKCALRHIDQVFVQSESVRSAFCDQFQIKDVGVVAFANTIEPISIQQVSDRTGFVYVATADPHKNHQKLFQAWKILSTMNLYPKLVLTAQSFDQVSSILYQEALSAGARIQLLSDLKRTDILSLYQQAEALIFPSLAESLGLPLIEAQQAGLPIIASELDYVRDLVDPAETFDPQSALSIARAVARFMKVQAPSRTQVVNATHFIKEVLRP